MVDDLAQARTDYEQGDWTAALDIWSDIEPDDMSADDLHHAALTAYLLGRRDTSVDFHQRAFSLYMQAGTPAGAMRCCFHLAMIFGTVGEHALEGGDPMLWETGDISAALPPPRELPARPHDATGCHGRSTAMASRRHTR
jgi:hypothetical protein